MLVCAWFYSEIPSRACSWRVFIESFTSMTLFFLAIQSENKILHNSSWTVPKRHFQLNGQHFSTLAHIAFTKTLFKRFHALWIKKSEFSWTNNPKGLHSFGMITLNLFDGKTGTAKSKQLVDDYFYHSYQLLLKLQQIRFFARQYVWPLTLWIWIHFLRKERCIHNCCFVLFLG